MKDFPSDLLIKISGEEEKKIINEVKKESISLLDTLSYISNIVMSIAMSVTVIF